MKIFSALVVLLEVIYSTDQCQGSERSVLQVDLTSMRTAQTVLNRNLRRQLNYDRAKSLLISASVQLSTV